MDARKVNVTEGGRLVIPASFQRALGISPGDTLLMDIEAGELRLRSIAVALREVQAQVQALNPTGRVLSEELISDRRLEAENE